MLTGASGFFTSIPEDVNLIVKSFSKVSIEKSEKNKIYLAYVRVICAIVMFAAAIQIRNAISKLLETGELERLAKAVAQFVLAHDIFKISQKITKLLSSQDTKGQTKFDKLKTKTDEEIVNKLADETCLQPLWLYCKGVWLKETLKFFSK